MGVFHSAFCGQCTLQFSRDELQLKDERQVRPEIHILFSPLAVKFDFEERCRSRSG